MVRGASIEEIEIAESGDYLTLDPAFCKIKHAVRILGGGNSSKTSALIEQILQLLEAGASPVDIRVVCASSAACLDFTECIRKKMDDQHKGWADEIEVVTTRDLAFHILPTENAQTIIGRTFRNGHTRLLSAFELDFILEDLKTLGSRPQRLRELLKFIFRGLTELADEGKGWLITVEEQEVLAFLRSELKFLQAVIEPELQNLSCKVLRKSDTIKKRLTKPHILVSEYQNLSRTSQLLCHLLATDSITISADETACAEIFDSYPYAEGIEEFLRINPGALTCILEKEKQLPDVDSLSWEFPEDEFSGVAALMREQVANGRAPESIAIICFHPQWYNKIICGLRAQDLPVRGLYQPLVLKGDIRDLERSLAFRIVTALRLLVEPNDSMAWRCWIGFGDYLTKSNIFVKAREEAEAEDPIPVFADVIPHWDDWQKSVDFIESSKDKRGSELLMFLAKALSIENVAKIPPLLVSLLNLGKTATASEMIASIEQMQFFPQFTSIEGITLTSFEMSVGLSFDEVVLAGFVNGFFPHRSFFNLDEITINQKRSMEEVDKRRLNSLLSVASGKLVLSHFKRIELKNAERLKLKSDRIILDEDLVRISTISISEFAKELL